MKTCRVLLVLSFLCCVGAMAQTPMTVQLTAQLSTSGNHQGDPVMARVTRPDAFKGDVVEGKVTQAGRNHGRAELSFSFDTLRHGSQTIPISSTVTSITNSKGQQGMDEEGQPVEMGTASPPKKHHSHWGNFGSQIGGMIGNSTAERIGSDVDTAVGMLPANVSASGPHMTLAPGSLIGLNVKANNGQDLASLSSNQPTEAAASSGGAGTAQASGAAAGGQPNLVAAKIDFIPGEKTIFFDDFSDMPPGEPPPHWKVRGGLVQLRMGGGIRELDIPENVTISSQPFSGPKDFTFQVTMTVPVYADWRFMRKGGKILDLGLTSNASQVTANLGNWYSPCGGGTGGTLGGGTVNANPNQPVNIAVWAQEGRLRAYINGKRVMDVNQLTFCSFDHLEFSLSNPSPPDDGLRSVRVAESAPDPGTVLVTSGKYVTHGIYFDTDSDVLKPESAPVIKEISTALYKNPSMKVEIDGYTDSTGDAAHNLDLSKRRAKAVMTVLVSQFGIDASRLTSNGFGAANPIASNDTPDGRAQNRRVEFVKQGANTSPSGSSGGGGGAGAGATAAPPSGSAMAAAGGSQAAKSNAAASGVELPSGTVITGKWDDGTDLKLKPPEAVALLFLSAIVDCQIPCDLQFNRYCSIAELVKGVKTDSGVNGLSRDPAQDTNYRYILTLSGKAYQIAAVPRRPGLGGWLFVNGTSSSAYHFNPNGPATEKNKKIADPGFGVTGESSNFERQ
jgi:OmpA-OmpF porin, OOP family